jgi:zinc transport system substrate-binding protein
MLMLMLILAITQSGCSQTDKQKDGNIRIVCTTFPQYDWVRQILGESADNMGNVGNVELTLLLNNRIDLHSYQPSVDDIAKISMCDLFIYLGGESDKWVGDALKGATNKNMAVISLLDVLGNAAKEEETLEGMEEEGEESGDLDADKADYDEHVWLSLQNAQIFCPVIADALSSRDANNAS